MLFIKKERKMLNYTLQNVTIIHKKGGDFMAKDLTKTRKDNESEEKRARKIKPLLLYQYLSSPRQYEERCD